VPHVLSAADAQARYLAEAVETATPAVRLGMLWDRLQLDLQRADRAFDDGDLYAIHDNLVQAQEILLALADTIRTDQWDVAPRLAALYRHLHGELVLANVHKDRERLAATTSLVAQLADAWRVAIAGVTEEPVDGVA
jgi:flagellar protein FliS